MTFGAGGVTDGDAGDVAADADGTAAVAMPSRAIESLTTDRVAGTGASESTAGSPVVVAADNVEPPASPDDAD